MVIWVFILKNEDDVFKNKNFSKWFRGVGKVHPGAEDKQKAIFKNCSISFVRSTLFHFYQSWALAVIGKMTFNPLVPDDVTLVSIEMN